MRDLIEKLNAASAAYYAGREIMSNYEYDKMYSELEKLEKETGIVFDDSPTQNVGSRVLGSLEKREHEYPCLSLDKTKDIDAFVTAFRENEKKAILAGSKHKGVVLMYKEDGSTVQLTYQNGELMNAVTRGNGTIGQVITHNALHMDGIPATIPYKGKLVVRGEAVMSYAEFNRINESLPDGAERYKNPRNLAAAKVSALNSAETKENRITFLAFKLVNREREDFKEMSFYESLLFLEKQGCQAVPYFYCSVADLKEMMEKMGANAETYAYSVDGLVAALNAVDYASKQPGTGHNPHISVGYAFKWADETAETVLRNIEWSASRTGLLNPVAVFDPVELEGTTVTRSTLHNVSTILEMDLKIGDHIEVYKANKIIPAVERNLDKSREWDGTVIRDDVVTRNHIPVTCPVCNSPVRIVSSVLEGSKTIVAKCENPNCQAKQIGRFTHFVERDCLNIIGLSEKTIETFVDRGFLKELSDFYHLDRYREEIVSMDGFGEKSYQNLIAAVEKSRKTEFVSLIHSLGIPNVGKGQAKLIHQHYLKTAESFGDDYVGNFIMDLLTGRNFTEIDGIGTVIQQSLTKWAEDNLYSMDTEFHRLVKELELTDTEKPENPETGKAILTGKTFVITGSVNHFKNRMELQEKIEELGGKATGSVTKNTSYLINNDVSSTSGKNKKAKELGIPVISEEDFLKMIGML